MRSLYFTAAESGRTRAQLRHGEATGRWTRVGRALYRFGPGPVTQLDRCLAPIIATGGAACGRVAGILHGLDGVDLEGPEVTVRAGGANKRAGVRRRELTSGVVEIGGVPCTDVPQTLLDLAALLDEDRWEQALESALRKRLTDIETIEALVVLAGTRRLPGVTIIRHVLGRRPASVAPTGSIMETLFLQRVVRRLSGVREPDRQVEVVDEHGEFVAFVDFAWPELGLFIELDGQHHEGQPVHDARRETGVVAARGWLVGRFTWDEVTRHPVATARRLDALLAQASRLHASRPPGRLSPSGR